MGLFYNQLSSTASTTTSLAYTPTNEQAAWFAIVYAAASVSGTISDVGRETFCKLLTSKEMYKGHEIIDYFFEFMQIRDHFSTKEIIQQAAKKVNLQEAPALFCITAETLLAKGYLLNEEKEILDFTARILSIDKTISAKIIEVLLLRGKGNYVFS